MPAKREPKAPKTPVGAPRKQALGTPVRAADLLFAANSPLLTRLRTDLFESDDAAPNVSAAPQPPQLGQPGRMWDGVGLPPPRQPTMPVSEQPIGTPRGLDGQPEAEATQRFLLSATEAMEGLAHVVQRSFADRAPRDTPITSLGNQAPRAPKLESSIGRESHLAKRVPILADYIRRWKGFLAATHAGRRLHSQGEDLAVVTSDAAATLAHQYLQLSEEPLRQATLTLHDLDLSDYCQATSDRFERETWAFMSRVTELMLETLPAWAVKRHSSMVTNAESVGGRVNALYQLAGVIFVVYIELGPHDSEQLTYMLRRAEHPMSDLHNNPGREWAVLLEQWWEQAKDVHLLAPNGFGVQWNRTRTGLLEVFTALTRIVDQAKCYDLNVARRECNLHAWAPTERDLGHFVAYLAHIMRTSREVESYRKPHAAVRVPGKGAAAAHAAHADTPSANAHAWGKSKGKGKPGGGGPKGGAKGGGGKGICYLFRDTGACRYGDQCAYRHDTNSGNGSGPTGGAGPSTGR